MYKAFRLPPQEIHLRIAQQAALPLVAAGRPLHRAQESRELELALQGKTEDLN